MVNMGMTTVHLIVKNPASPIKQYSENFLVDSGASYTVVPENILRTMGIVPDREEVFTFADGRTVKRKVGNALKETVCFLEFLHLRQ